MTIYDDIFPFGLGTNRFDVKSSHDEKGIDDSVKLVIKALDAGVRYVDVAHTYSKGMAFPVLKKAFASTRHPFKVTLKTQLAYEKTADDVMRRAESSLKGLGISKFEYGVLWTVMSYDEYVQIMAEDGLYDGLKRLRSEGLIKYITMSTHAPVNDIIKIINDRVVEGLTISYSILNHVLMKKVLDKALEQNIGITVMNPLGGGLIPNNDEFFSFLKNDSDPDTATAALRFVNSHPAVKVVIVGLRSGADLVSTLSAFTQEDSECASTRTERVTEALRKIDGFCTGCGYCDGCPHGIPISSIMQSRNSLKLASVDAYNRPDEVLSKNIEICRKLGLDYSFLPESPQNPCIRCGWCEKKCTQNLKISDSIKDTYEMFDRVGYSKLAHRERLDILLNEKCYEKVGFYPAGGSTAKVIDTYINEFGKPPFEIVLFDSNPAMWDTRQGAYYVCSSDKIEEIKPDCIVISNYKFQEEIYANIIKHEDVGIRIEKLYAENDVPWMF